MKHGRLLGRSGQFLAGPALVLGVLSPGCTPGYQSVSLRNDLARPVTVEVIRVSENSVDRMVTELPTAGTQTSAVMRGAPLLFAEARVWPGPAARSGACFVFELPRSGASLYTIREENGAISLERVSSVEPPRMNGPAN